MQLRSSVEQLLADLVHSTASLASSDVAGGWDCQHFFKAGWGCQYYFDCVCKQRSGRHSDPSLYVCRELMGTSNHSDTPVLCACNVLTTWRTFREIANMCLKSANQRDLAVRAHTYMPSALHTHFCPGRDTLRDAAATWATAHRWQQKAAGARQAATQAQHTAWGKVRLVCFRVRGGARK